MTLFRALALTLLPMYACSFVAVAQMEKETEKQTGKVNGTIRFEAADRTFHLDGGATSYVFGIDEQNGLRSMYWGGRLPLGDKLPPPHSNPELASVDPPVNTTPREYVGWGAALFNEPSLKVTFTDGGRDLELVYVSHTVREDELTVTLKDVRAELYVELHYTVDGASGVIGRRSVITNRTKAPVYVEQAAAATWNLPRSDDYSLRYLTGRWAGEWNLQQQTIKPGQTVLESRRGSTSHQINPWFAIERGRETDEDNGPVWIGALAWSGSWRITVEETVTHDVRVTGGFNPFDFSYKLLPSESLATPVFYAGYSAHGIGGASRLMHQFELTRILPQAPHPRPRPVLYNSWEATEFAVGEGGQMALAEKAARIGIERFVMDDGWFGQRMNDHAGLGDWYVNPKKFPHGLKPLIDKVHGLGMDFGLWVEPEMVNPDSDLYRKHPDWVLNFTGRPRTEARNQLVLNLARKDVREYVAGFLDKLLNENDIAFLKWDYNRSWSEPGWPAVANDEQKKVYVTYTENLYGILRELRAKHPKVEIESCAGGGGRTDLGILGMTDEVWASDNTDPFDRLKIQDGFTYAYTPGIMMAWVTDSPHWLNQRSTSLSYRFLSSMQGSLGVGANLNKWAPEDFDLAQKMVTAYKQVRETVQHGSLYRLVSPRDGSEGSVTESVSLDQRQAVLFTFLHSSEMGAPFPRVFLRGLALALPYRMTPISGSAAKDTPLVASGSYWMNYGLEVMLRGDLQAAAFRFEEVTTSPASGSLDSK